MVEALNDRVVDDQATIDRYHLTIQAEADRLARLVDDLFELSRIEAGAVELRLEEASIGDLVSDAVASVAAVAGRKGVRVVGTAFPSPIAELAPPEMSRVVRNLLDNAIRHTPAGGEVVVEVGEEGDDVVVAVSDQCGGIADDDLDRVFDLAFRGDPARTPGTPGGGFGLAIARGLVNAHDGAIAVRNADRGCCFTVRLPRRGGQRSNVPMSRTARSVPRTVPVTFDVPVRAE
jgi:signal transduction histidine kinase